MYIFYMCVKLNSRNALYYSPLLHYLHNYNIYIVHYIFVRVTREHCNDIGYSCLFSGLVFSLTFQG